MQQLFEKGSNLNIDELDIALAELELEKSKSIEAKTINKVISNPKSKFIGYLMLNHAKQKEQFEKIDAKEIAVSAIVYSEEIDAKKDSLVFYDTKEIKFNNKKIVYYFFKRINIEEDSYQTNKEQLTGIAFITEGSKINIKGYYKLTSKTYLEEKEISSLQNTMIDESLNDNHIRVSYGKLKDQMKNYMNEYADEY